MRQKAGSEPGKIWANHAYIFREPQTLTSSSTRVTGDRLGLELRELLKTLSKGLTQVSPKGQVKAALLIP